VTENELGVPFPGVPVRRERWTRTRTALPPAGKTFDWRAVFGREAPRVLDLGCGNGRYLLGSALARPTHDHVGVDVVPQAIDHACRRATERGLTNVRYAWGDATVFLLERSAEASVDELHVYHPQPYYEVADRSKRMLTPLFLARAWHVVRPSGLLVLQTDNPRYWEYLLEVVPSFFRFEAHPGPWPEAPRGRTRREIVARSKGLEIFRGVGTRRDELASATVLGLGASLPEPAFDANKPGFD
jgi:tRNA (guanine-N7-)-methyltransferase